MRRLAVLVLAAAARATEIHVPGDFASIQAAVDAAIEGDEIVIATGSYEETIELLFKQDLTLRGQGQVVLRGGDVDTAVLLLDDCTGVRVERLRFEQPPLAAIEVDGGEHVTVADCTIEDAAQNGVRVSNSSSTVIERCRILRPAGPGIEVSNCENTLIWRCRVEDAADMAIAVAGLSGAHVERCTLLGSGGYAITLDGTSQASVLRNLIKDTSLGGIDVNGGSATVRDNRLVRAGDVPVRVETFGASAVIEDNRIIEAVDTAILVHASDVVVRRNRVVKSEAFGIVVDGNDPTVSDNVVVHPANSGILLLEAVTVGSVGHNRVQHAGDSGFLISGTGLLVHDNEALGSVLDGFFLLDGPSSFVRNRAKGSGLFDLDDQTGAGNVYVDNEFGTIAPAP